MEPGTRGDQLAVLTRVVEQLDRMDIAYMLSGSLAYSYYVEPRMTRDIDLVVDLEPAAARLLAGALGTAFYCDPDAAATAASRRGLFNAIDEQRLVKVDFIVRKDEPFRREEFRRRRLVQIDTVDVWIVSVEDLILSKLLWSRKSESAIQRRDVQTLVVRGPALDWPYLDRWAHTLGVGELLEALRHD